MVRRVPFVGRREDESGGQREEDALPQRSSLLWIVPERAGQECEVWGRRVRRVGRNAKEPQLPQALHDRVKLLFLLSAHRDPKHFAAQDELCKLLELRHVARDVLECLTQYQGRHHGSPTVIPPVRHLRKAVV